MDLARALTGDKKWEDSDIEEKSAFMKAMGYPSKVPAKADIVILHKFSDYDVGLPRKYSLHQEHV